MATTTWTRGTITLTNGSATVTGDGTEWDLAELEGGETLAVVTDPPIDFSMTVQTVVGAEEIALTAPWTGATLEDVGYLIIRDYTGAPANAPIPQRGDMNPWAIIGEAFRRLNNAIASVAPVWGSITGTLADQTDLAGALDAVAETAIWGSISGDIEDQTDLQNALDGKLDDPEANGIVVRTGGDGASVARAITGTPNQVVVSNGDGVSGDPTLSLPQDIHTGAAPTFAALTLSEGTLIRSSVSIADDNVLFVPLAFNAGRLDMLVGGPAAARCVSTLSFRCTGTPYCRKVVIDQGITDPFDTTLGPLSAGGGADGKITVSTDSDPQGIYISNRMGSTISVVLFFWRAA